MAKIALSEMIEQLRQELQEAVDKGKDADIRFALEEVTLEAQVQIAVKSDAKTKVRFWVVDGEVAAGGSEATTQKVVLKLKPERASDPPGTTMTLSDDLMD